MFNTTECSESQAYSRLFRKKRTNARHYYSKNVQNTELPNGTFQSAYGKHETSANSCTKPNFCENIFTTDSYYPGIVEDSINKKLNFNQISLEESQANQHEPKSLIAAFDERVQHEEMELKKMLNRQNVQEPLLGGEPSQLNASSTFSSKHTTPHRHREEHIRAAAIAFDLYATMRTQPMNDLLHAVDALLKGEMMNEYDRVVQAAENAVHGVAPEQIEQAATYGAHSFKIGKITQSSSTAPGTGTYKPLEIVSYLGTTRPNEEPK